MGALRSHACAVAAGQLPVPAGCGCDGAGLEGAVVDV